MPWTVTYSKKAEKQYHNLPPSVQDRLDLLAAEIEHFGPIRGNWKNYSKLEGRKRQHHCHIKTGKPTYVAVWEEADDTIKLIEVIYAGTHEKAPY
ncbi:cytotoxic translational repressor of toxin-antitoxin stability system [Geobacter sp. FeAm09]|nr:cytotoxic translational repressor of toxin-antitoxin stability system [Geobacter sp. FeAm09]